MDYVFESPLEPDILLGPAFSQQAAPGGAPAHAGGAQGRRRLLSQGRRTRDPATRLLFDETRAWLKSTDRRAVFSFESICDCLDIDVDYLRRVCVNGGRPAGATAASARLREGEAGACSHVRARVRRATARQRARRAVASVSVAKPASIGFRTVRRSGRRRRATAFASCSSITTPTPATRLPRWLQSAARSGRGRLRSRRARCALGALERIGRPLPAAGSGGRANHHLLRSPRRRAASTGSRRVSRPSASRPPSPRW